MRHAHEWEKKILYHLEKVNTVNQSQRFKDLQDWQSERLLETHIKLYQQKRFQPAMNFFKDELYSAEHFQKRNRQIIKALPLMCRTLPESVLVIVEKAAELHNLSLELDTLLMHYISIDTEIQNLSMKEWTQAYRASSNKNDRDRQIELIEFLGNELARIVNKPMIGTLLSWAKTPAHLAGYQDIHSFVCNGYDAFSHLENPQDFLIPVITKEKSLSDEWFISNEPD